jgi:putative ABC transport system permease protein
MRWLDKLRLRSRSLFSRSRVERDLARELQFHLENQIQENIEGGMNAQNARDAALRTIGGLDQIKGECRDQRRVTGVDHFAQDLRFALRMLRRNLGFTLVATLVVAVSIGANTAIFSVADAVLFKPLPYAEPDRVFILQMLDRKSGSRFTQVPFAHVQVLNEHHRGLGDVGMAGSGRGVRVEGPEGVENVSSAGVTPAYFDVLGTRAAAGRLFSSHDPLDSGRTAVLAYSTWQQRFGGDRQIIGRSVALGSRTFDIIGVLPRGFVFPSLFAGSPEVVTLLEPPKPGAPGGVFHPIVRLEPGVSREQAQAEIEALVLQSPGNQSSDSVPILADIRSVIYPTGRRIMGFLLAASVFVLLVGCAHLANMFLVQTKAGEQEIGMRLALGAGPLRLIRPVVFQALMISVAGAVLAVLATAASFDFLLTQVPPAAYRTAPVGMSLRVVAYALLLGVAASLVFSVAPAWRLAGFDALALIQRRVRQDGAHRKIGGPMIATQVTLAIVLVFGAAVAVRALISVLNTPLGFTSDNVATADVFPERPDPLARQEFYVQVIQALERRADIVSAGAAGSPPLGGYTAFSSVETANSATRIGTFHVLPGFFETVNIPLIRGRLPDWNDVREGGRAAVIGKSAAGLLYPDQDPIGKTVTQRGGRQFTIVGLVADARQSMDRAETPAVYVIPGEDIRPLTLFVRMRDTSDAALTSIKKEINAHSPGGPVRVVRWGESIRALSAYRNPRFQSLVLGAFATLALGLTALSTFSVVSFLVAMRTREFGIRSTLGAPPSSLVGLATRQTLLPVACGILLGMVMIWWTGQLVKSQLGDVDTKDPATLILVIATVATAAVVAAYVPARRATKVDPMVALRHE